MAKTNIIDMVKGECKLYKGGIDNPYDPEKADDFDWPMVYLKHHIWDAEMSVVRNFSWWNDLWTRQHPESDLTKQERAEEIYKLAIFDKLRKIERDDMNFRAMYFSL